MSGGPLRVVLVAGEAAGGVAAHVADLAAALPSHGVAVEVAAPAATAARLAGSARAAPAIPAEGAETLRGARVHALPGGDWVRPDRAVAAARALRRIVDTGGRPVAGDATTAAQRDPGSVVVHAHGLRAGLVAVLAHAAPVVVTWHNDLPPAPGRAAGREAAGVRAAAPGAASVGVALRRAAAFVAGRIVARRAAVTLVASDDLLPLVRRLGARDGRLLEVPAPEPAPPSLDARARVRAELDADDRPVLLAVGRLAPQKDPDLLLDAAALLRDDPRRPLVALAGDGPLRGHLQGRVTAERLPVVLLGARDDVPDLLAAADLAVLTSRWEARALVAQEALRAGVPLVATAVGGVPGLVGDAAVLVPYADPGGLASAVRTLLDDPARRAELAAAGQARAATWPTLDDACRQLTGVYAAVMAGRAAASMGPSTPGG